MSESKTQLKFDPRYVQEYLLDESEIATRLLSPVYVSGRILLRDYAGLAEEQIPAYVAKFQKRAYAICPYPCIGQLRFIVLRLPDHDLYPTIIARIKEGEKYLDIGCCFAQDIRRLAYDGAPTTNCIGVDIEPGLLSLSYDFFQDKETLGAKLCAADIFDNKSEVWTSLYGTVDVIHTSSVFHLFGIEKQRAFATRIVKLLKPIPGSTVLGMDVAAAGEPGEIPVVSEDEPSHCHSYKTWQALWAEVSAGGICLKVEASFKEMPVEVRRGLLANPDLVHMVWVVKVV